ncbi:MAG: ROK family protein [Bacteroidota bacterium]|nr:ROK family protein [Bacteroidota bacterium]
MAETYWGIDLGGTKIEGVVIQTVPDLKILSRLRVPTEQQHGYDHIISQISKLIEKLKAETGLIPNRIGIGTPGTIDSDTHLIKNSNTMCLVGKPMKVDLEKYLGIPVTLENDANCFAMAETHLGVVPEYSKNPEVVFGVIMGTGVGSGVVVNGKIVHGKHGIAGEWGHNRIADQGELCYCGHEACVETFISGPATERYFEKISGLKKPMVEIYELFKKEDPFAIETIDRLMYYFGKSLAVIVNIIDPEIIVFGGGLGNLDIIYERGKAEVLKHLFNTELKTLFLKPKLGDSAGVIGAALL